MVVEDVLDLLAFESTDEYRGRYHIIGGLISPIKGIGPDELNIASLLARIKNKKSPSELILATSPSLEGEATAMYIKQELEGISEVKITRIARGVPSGADLDYTDKYTLTKALSGRDDF